MHVVVQNLLKEKFWRGEKKMNPICSKHSRETRSHGNGKFYCVDCEDYISQREVLHEYGEAKKT